MPAPVDIEALDQAGDQAPAMARGASLVRRFRVTVHQPGLRKLTFLASASEYDDMPYPLHE